MNALSRASPLVGKLLADRKNRGPAGYSSPKLPRRPAIRVLHETAVLSDCSPRDTVPVQPPAPPHSPRDTVPIQPPAVPDSPRDKVPIKPGATPGLTEEEDIEADGARYLRRSPARRVTVTELVTGSDPDEREPSDMEGEYGTEEGPWTELTKPESPGEADPFDSLRHCWAVAFHGQTVPEFADLNRQEIAQHLTAARNWTEQVRTQLEELRVRLENGEYCVKYLEYMQYLKQPAGGGPGSDSRCEGRDYGSDEEFYSVDELDRDLIRASLVPAGESFTQQQTGNTPGDTPGDTPGNTPVSTPADQVQNMEDEQAQSGSDSLSPIETDPFGDNKFGENNFSEALHTEASPGQPGDICDLDTIDLEIDEDTDKDSDNHLQKPHAWTTNDRVSIRIKRTYNLRSGGDRKSVMSVDSVSSDLPEDDVFESRGKDADSPDTGLGSPGSSDSEEDHHYRMRKLVIEGVLDTESVYLSCLDVLLKYKKIFEVSGTTSQPVLCSEDCALIFYKVRELHNIHNDFHKGLQPKVTTFSPQQEVGDSFKLLVSQLPTYEHYLKNYERALQTIDRCRRGNEQFNNVAASVKNGDNHQTLEALIVRPVERVTRITLVLQDLLKHTPVSHPDHAPLKESLETSQAFLDKINKSAFSSQGDKTDGISGPHRPLVKDAFLVELCDGKRKLRHVFLYPDLLICATQRTTRKIFSRESMRESYECQWYIPLGELMLIAHDVQHIDSSPVPVTSEADMDSYKARVAELRKEYRKLKASNSDNPSQRKVAKGIEKVKKRLAEQEAALTLAFPSLPFRVFHKNGKTYTFLMSSGDERAEWKEAITKLQEKYPSRPSLTNYEVQALLNSTRVRKVNTVGSLLLNDNDEPGLSGSLCVTVQSAAGFTEEGRVHCLIEVDSFGHFEQKAKTGTCSCTTEASWNEDFDVELEEAQTLRVSCYWEAPKGGLLKSSQASPPGGRRSPIPKISGPRKPSMSHPLHHCGAAEIELLKQSLEDNRRHPVEVVLNGKIKIALQLRYMSRATLKRQVSMPFKGQKGMFGVPLGTIARVEGRPVPQIVELCTAEVEKRGVEELGIYRISAVSSDVQKLKKAFDTRSKDLPSMLQETDINAVAGVLKLYFRELPEPLFTNELYPSFADCLALADPDAKERSMMSLFHELPEVNHATALHVMRHLRRVAEKEEVNKMNINNLSTVFGPTLLRPSEATPGDMSSAAFVGDVLTQVGVLQFLLNLPGGEDRRASLSSETVVTVATTV